jgi:nucleotide-binding universal stress UspA family protein
VAYEAPAMPDLFGMIRDSTQAYLEQVRQRVDDVPVRLGAFLGSPADQLKLYAEQYHIDVVVMSPHGRRGLVRSILGSVTDRMIHGPAPVLVVHPK